MRGGRLIAEHVAQSHQPVCNVRVRRTDVTTCNATVYTSCHSADVLSPSVPFRSLPASILFPPSLPFSILSVPSLRPSLPSVPRTPSVPESSLTIDRHRESRLQVDFSVGSLTHTHQP